MVDVLAGEFPKPPRGLVNTGGTMPSKDLEQWAWATFLDRQSKLFNSDHEILESATIGFVYTTVENLKGGKRILGTAELGKPASGGKWQKARAEQQLRDWFGEVPDFLITIDALYVLEADPASVCALLEHELYHCAQEVKDLIPQYTQEGMPKWALRGHDVEEFVGVVRRYGTSATYTEAFVRAANDGPEIALADIRGACGNCAR